MKRFLVVLLALMPGSLRAADMLPLDEALRATYRACVGIDDKLSDYKKMAGINTAITAVGTGLNAGATVVGIVKASKDKQALSYEKLMEELRELEKEADDSVTNDVAAFEKEFNLAYDAAVANADKYQSEYEKLTKQSKNLGNWRTGLMAGGVATNIAGAIIASKNGANGDIQDMVDECLASVATLNNSIGQARINGQDVTEAQVIVSACREYETVNISSISKRARGAEISSIVGAGIGAAGTVTSAVANTDKTRDNNTDEGRKHEKNLNLAANIMAGGATAATASAMIFNATQIAAIKRVATVAANCEGVLK